MLVDVLRKILPIKAKQGFGLWTVAQAGKSKWLAYPYYFLLCGKLPEGLEMMGEDCRIRYMEHDMVTPRDGIMAAIDVFQDKVYEKAWSPRGGDTVIDVGAYVGMFSVRASKCVGREGLVIAMEPEAKNFSYLADNVKELGNVTAIEEAASDRTGQIPLYISGASPCHSIVVEHGKRVDVKAETLDNLVLRLNIKRVDFIKIDAEGAELSILKGAERCLAYDGIRLAIASYHDLANGFPELPLVVAFLRRRGFNCRVDAGYVYADKDKVPMRIAIVNDTIYPYSVGGAQKRVWEIAKRLYARGHIVHLFGMKYWGGSNVLVKEGVYLHGVCPVQELYVKGRRSIREAIYFALKLVSPLLQEKVDIVDCSNFPYFPCFTGRLHSLFKGSKLVITWLEVWNNYWYEYLGWMGIFGKLIERVTAKLTNILITDSEHVKWELPTIGVKNKVIRSAPDGVDIAEVNRIKTADSGYDVIYAGRLLSHKNIDILVEAVKVIKNKLPMVKCGIIGDGPTKKDLELQVDGLGLRDNIEFLGFLPSSKDVFAHMKASKVFVHPSTREGCGLATPEANACGLPVVAIDCPTNAALEIIKDGENGFLCELSAKSIADKVLLALERRGYMSKRSREMALVYDWDRITEKIESYYKEALNGYQAD